jgi:hypothetical protein
MGLDDEGRGNPTVLIPRSSRSDKREGSLCLAAYIRVYVLSVLVKRIKGRHCSISA